MDDGTDVIDQDPRRSALPFDSCRPHPSFPSALDDIPGDSPSVCIRVAGCDDKPISRVRDTTQVEQYRLSRIAFAQCLHDQLKVRWKRLRSRPSINVVFSLHLYYDPSPIRGVPRGG